MPNPIETFFAAWSVADADERRAMVGAVFADTATYADPRTPERMTGPDAVAEYIGMFTQAAPGATASVIKSDAIDDTTRVTIEFKMADGMTQHGQYFVEHEGTKITRMIGFVGTGTPV